MKSHQLFFVVLALLASNASGGIVVNFEELNTFTGTSPAGGGSFYNGNNRSGTTNSNGWSSQGVLFGNDYNGDSLPAFDFWSGWSYSNVVNTTSAGFLNQYAAAPGGGSNGSAGSNGR